MTSGVHDWANLIDPICVFTSPDVNRSHDPCCHSLCRFAVLFTQQDYRRMMTFNGSC